MPNAVLPRRGILRIGGARQGEAGEITEVLLAVLAITHAGAVPAIAEHSVHLVHGYDFARHPGHKVEVVGAQGAGDPEFRHGPVTPLLALRIHRDPIGVRVVDVLVSGVGVGAGDDVHAELAAAGRHLAEGIGVAEELAAVVERDLGGVEGYAAAGAEAGRVAVGALEIVEPELRVVIAGVVFDEGDLGPAHGAVIPLRFASLGGERGSGGRGQKGGVADEISSCGFHGGGRLRPVYHWGGWGILRNRTNFAPWDWVCSCEIGSLGILRNRANPGSIVKPERGGQFSTALWEGILRNRANLTLGFGFVRAKVPLLFVQLSKILGGRASREDVPCAALLRRMVPGGILRNKANSRGGPLYEALTSGISVAGGVDCGFGDGF